MAHKKTILLIVSVLMLMALSGCLDSHRKEAVQSRWEETLDLARLEEAQISLDKGRWEYAQRVLEDCSACFDPSSSLSGQAEQILAKIQTDRLRNAKAGDESQRPENIIY